MRRLIAAALLVAGLTLGGIANAATNYAPVAQLIKAFANPEGALGWEELDARKQVKWIAGRTLLRENAPDGSSVARPGIATIDGRTFNVGATGSMAGVGSIYFSEDAPAAPVATVVAGLQQAGIDLAMARCPRNAGRADPFQGWYHITTSGVPGYLYIGRLKSGRQGYTLYLSELPLMSQTVAANYFDCNDGKATANAAGEVVTGQAGIVAVIEALLRPAGSATRLPWHSPLPSIQWNKTAPNKFPRGESFGGNDTNPRTLDGHFKTRTTEMTATATGDAQGANRFYLDGGRHLPRDAVFNALHRDGYTLTAVTCGKPYIKMSENWYRITGNGKQPAILYRYRSVSIGEPSEGYALWLDNTVQALLPGQSHARGGTCPRWQEPPP